MFSCLKWGMPRIGDSQSRQMRRTTSNLSDAAYAIQNASRAIDMSRTADKILIVGGGVCALWFAMHLIKFIPQFLIIIVERRANMNDTHIVSVQPEVLKSYVGIKDGLGSSFVIGDFRTMLLECIAASCTNIRIITEADHRTLPIGQFKAVFIMDGAQRSFSNTVFTESVPENVDYYVELQYTTRHESVPLSDALKQMVLKRFHTAYTVHEVVCGTRVVLRVSMPYGTYNAANHQSKAYSSIPEAQRCMLNYWLNVRAVQTKETMLGTINIRYFAFPVFVRTRFAVQRDVPFFVLGAAAFQTSLEDGLSRSLELCATVAPIFVKDISKVTEEYNYMCENFLCKAVERRRAPTGDVCMFEDTQDWEEDFFE